jgi:hypothetical protein
LIGINVHMTDSIDILKKRLASGEIGVEEYERIISVLRDTNTSGTVRKPVPTSPEKLIAQCDEFSLYATCVQIGDERRDLVDVSAVTNSSSEGSINFVPYKRESWCCVTFKDGRNVELIETSTSFFKKAHHARIRQFGTAIQQATSQSRFDDLCQLLRSKRIIQLATGDKAEPEIWLTADGMLQTSKRKFRIAACAATGTFGVGTRSYRTYSSAEVLISESKKPLLG